MRKSFFTVLFMAVLGVICLASCCHCNSDNDNDEKTVKYYTWLCCSEDLLKYVTPTMEFEDNDGNQFSKSLSETEFVVTSSQYTIVNGDTVRFLKAGLLNRMYDKFGVRNQIIVKYVPKDVDLVNQLTCFGHTIMDSVVSISNGTSTSYSQHTTAGANSTTTDNVVAYINELIAHPDTMICVVDEDGKIKIK